MPQQIQNFQNWDIRLVIENNRFHFELTNKFGDTFTTDDCEINYHHHYQGTTPEEQQQEALAFLEETFASVVTTNKKFNVEVIKNSDGKYKVYIGPYGLKAGGWGWDRIAAAVGAGVVGGLGVAATFFSGGLVVAIPAIGAVVAAETVAVVGTVAAGAGAQGLAYSVTAKEFKGKEFATNMAVGGATSLAGSGVVALGNTLKVTKTGAQIVQGLEQLNSAGGQVAKNVLKTTLKAPPALVDSAVSVTQTVVRRGAIESTTAVVVKGATVSTEAIVRRDAKVLGKLSQKEMIKTATIGALAGNISEGVSSISHSKIGEYTTSALGKGESSIMAHEVVTQTTSRAIGRGTARFAGNVVTEDNAFQGVGTDAFSGAIEGFGRGARKGTERVYKLREEKQLAALLEDEDGDVTVHMPPKKENPASKDPKKTEPPKTSQASKPKTEPPKTSEPSKPKTEVTEKGFQRKKIAPPEDEIQLKPTASKPKFKLPKFQEPITETVFNRLAPKIKVQKTQEILAYVNAFAKEIGTKGGLKYFRKHQPKKYNEFFEWNRDLKKLVKSEWKLNPDQAGELPSVLHEGGAGLKFYEGNDSNILIQNRELAEELHRLAQIKLQKSYALYEPRSSDGEIDNESGEALPYEEQENLNPGKAKEENLVDLGDMPPSEDYSVDVDINEYRPDPARGLTRTLRQNAQTVVDEGEELNNGNSYTYGYR